MYISRQSRSPLSKDLIKSSAVARLVASGILCSSQSRTMLLTSGSCDFGFRGSRRKITRSISLCSICAPSCWEPPRCPARDIYVSGGWQPPRSDVRLFRLQTTGFFARIPRYAIQKFCINFFFESCAISPIFIKQFPLIFFSAVIQHLIQTPFPNTKKAKKSIRNLQMEAEFCIRHQTGGNKNIKKIL